MANNASKLSEELNKILGLGGISDDTDILYAFVPGQKYLFRFPTLII